jgi:hypothetical protein
MESILDITHAAFGGDAVQRLSSVLHESPSATQRGVETALPASLAGLAALASSEPKAAELLGAFRGGNYPHAEAGEVSRVIGDATATTRLAQSGQGFLSQMFGGKFNGIAEAIAGQTGVSRSSAFTLLGLAAPLVLGALGKETQARNLDAGGLARLLSDQGNKVSGLLPAPLTSMIGALGHGRGDSIPRIGHTVQASPAVERTRDKGQRAEIEPRPNPLWLILPLAALAVLGLWLFNRARSSEHRHERVPIEQRSYRGAPEPAPSDSNQPRHDQYNR